MRQMAQKSGVIKFIFFGNPQRETFDLCKANPITKSFRNRREDKGKPERTSIRYGMKLSHHSTRNRHGMSRHLRRVITDPNLPICTTSVCAVYVHLPCSNCRLYISIRTRTVLYSSVSGLNTQSSTPTERLAWQAITNCHRYNYAPGNAHAMSNWTKQHFSGES